MRKEEIRGLIIYTLLIVIAVIVGLTVVRPLLEGEFSPTKMSPFGFLIVTIIVAYLVNAIGLELLHLLGAIFGGFAITSFNILGLCFYKVENKWKFGIRDFNGLSGETKFAPKKEKTNINLVSWFPLFGFAIELASCIVVYILIKGSLPSKIAWLGSASIIIVLIASLLAFYNFIPLKLDTLTDGYRIRLFANPINVEAYNKMLVIQEDQRLGKKVENVPVFSEITEYTAEINMLAMYHFLELEKYDEAKEIIDVLLKHKQVLSPVAHQRLIAQKLYLAVLCEPILDAKRLYEEICPVEVRRFIANDVSMQSIRAYIMIAGMIEESESEVLFAKSKVEKAKRKALASEIKVEEKLLDKALDYVYKAHPKWGKENAAE